MQGLMMDIPLLISGLIQYAADYHGEAEIVAREIEGDIHRYTYAQAHPRIKRMALALQRLGMKPGDRVGTLAWNTHVFRDVLCGARHGLCAAHGQSAAVSRAACLHHQPRKLDLVVAAARSLPNRRTTRRS